MKIIYIIEGKSFYEEFFVFKKYMLFFVLVSFVVEDGYDFFLVELVVFIVDEEVFLWRNGVIFFFWSLGFW